LSLLTDTKIIQLEIKDQDEIQALFGPNDVNLKHLEQKFDVMIITRGEDLTVKGSDENTSHVKNVLETLLTLLRKGITLTERDVIYAIQLEEKNMIEELTHLYQEKLTVNSKGKPILIKTLGQKHYVSAVKRCDMVFGIGPAGTGKTFLAVVMAVTALKEGQVKKIVLTRPAVEAGESLGFLPGDLKEKVDPYLRPLYDALHEILGMETTVRLMERGTIEVAPLAYMRGRTLDDAFVILDEAQNTTKEQMKMFLTRLGFGSKMVINGDLTQVDLPKGKQSGLNAVITILGHVKDIPFVYLQQTDVVRHTLVQQIINAYETNEKKEE
jgi:phosphate starvation-inducible PhoH-like protein